MYWIINLMILSVLGECSGKPHRSITMSRSEILKSPSLVAFWDFKEAAGTARKSLKGDYELKEGAGAIAHNTEGVFKTGSAQIDSGKYLYIPRSSLKDLNIHGRNAQVTVIAWFKPTHKKSWQAIAGVWNESRGKRQYAMFFNAPKCTDYSIMERAPCSFKLHGHFSDVGTNTAGKEACITYASSGGEIKLNEWICAAITYDGKAIKAYVNGKLNSWSNHNPFTFEAGIFDGKANGSDFTVGSVDAHGIMNNFFVGLMGGLAVYNKALSDMEIESISRAY